MGLETELKFRVPARKLRNLVRGQVPGGVIGDRKESHLVSTYFDTAKHELRHHGLSLRVRQMGDKRIQTIKSTNGAQFGRGEWEIEIDGDAPDLRKANGTPLEGLGLKKLRKNLKPLFETSFHRTTLPVRTRISEIELAIDRGKIIAGRRSGSIEELELELKKGHPKHLFRLAKTIERRAQAELYLRTKSERGYELVDGRKGRAIYAEPIRLEQDMEAREAFRVIARSTFRHFAANADAVRNLDPEGVHQMRVGLRRLRTAISLFSGMLSGRAEEMKAELKWLTNELAPAREIDVFVREKISHAARGHVPRRGAAAIQEEFAARRDAALERARRAITSQRCRSLLVDGLQWIEAGNKGSRMGARAPIGKVAPDMLRRRVKKMLKAGRELKNLPARERHKFRIRIKKIRYATEFFESLVSGRHDRKRLARVSGHLKKIQDALGSLNDLVAHQKMATDVALATSAQDRRARAFAFGVVLGREEEAVKPLMKTAVKEVAALRRMGALSIAI